MYIINCLANENNINERGSLNIIFCRFSVANKLEAKKNNEDQWLYVKYNYYPAIYIFKTPEIILLWGFFKQPIIHSTHGMHTSYDKRNLLWSK